MCVKKLNYYLEDASIILMCDHLPLKKFLKRNTLNSKVNNWAVELSAHQIEFKYIKEIKNTLADTMSRLIQINPEITLPEEEEGKEYGYAIFEPLPPLPTMEEIITMTGRLKPKKNIKIHNPQVIRKQAHEEKCEEMIESTTEIDATDTQSAAPIKPDNDPIILPDEEIKLPIEDDKLHQMQRKDKFCSNIIQQLETGKLSSGNPYYLEEGILKRYVDDHKQRFEVIVLPRDLAPVTLRLAHEEMGHNGIPRTYALLRRFYYWKGLKPMVKTHVKACKLCQIHNKHVVKYNKLNYDAKPAPMRFISMDVIGQFDPPLKQGNKFALTVICMHTGFTFCIPTPN